MIEQTKNKIKQLPFLAQLISLFLILLIIVSFFPIIITSGLTYFAYKKINNKKLKYIISGGLSVTILFAWLFNLSMFIIPFIDTEELEKQAEKMEQEEVIIESQTKDSQKTNDQTKEISSEEKDKQEENDSFPSKEPPLSSDEQKENQEEQDKSDELVEKVFGYEIVEIEEQKKGGNIDPLITPKYTLIVARVVISGGVDDEEKTKATLDKILSEIKESKNPDGITIFAYDRKEDIDKAFTLGKAEWWPKGHTFAYSNKENIENKETFETSYEMREKESTKKPTEFEYQVSDRIEELLNQNSDYLYTYDSQEMEDFENEVVQQVAEEFGISVEEVDRIIIKILIYNQ